ncbi:ATP-binding protein [Magnetospirillum fulvum]|uniref:histidine kinase n=1 Tax=Magnetospirillum fulvum MGU-K5 TaxID=1316936 RepID=S9SCI5_MAGFU|nr:ATP-binding protein [Magnetospirillum fulvum]EPY02434.1 Signal transduction histidine kinase [Magnetospirillum fulvum MGU-K5]
MIGPRSLRSRLILGAALWLVLAIALGGWVLGNAFSNAVEASFRERLRAHLRALVAVVEISPAGSVGIGRPVGEPRFDQPYSGWYWQVSDGETVRARSRSLWDFALPVSRSAGEGTILFRRDVGPRDEALETAERDLIFPDSDRLLHLSVSASRLEIDTEVRDFNLLLTLALGGLGLGLITAVAFQVGYGLRPLGQLAQALDRLRQQGGRLGGHYPREVAPLVAAMNEVLDHDERMIARARTHVGNLAHGLKTPLAVIEAELGGGRPDRAVMSGQIARANRLIDVHLSRARAEATPSGSLAARACVAEVAAELKAALVRIHAGRDLSIVLDCAPESLAPIARDDLAEILGNLMDNACKWAKSRVRVASTATTLTVEDDGRGLSPEETEVATQRGARLDESAPGSGLGLAIVADLAALSGVDLTFGRSEWGGLKVSLQWDDRARPAAASG